MDSTKTHVMIVDDEASMRVLLKDFLESQGYQVCCHSSGCAAIKSLEQGAKADVIVADVRMTPMSGIELLRTVKQNSPDLPIFLFTAAGSPDEKIQALKIGAFQYFFKPFPLIDLKSSIEKALGLENPSKKS